jgi:hypothetical protein
MCTSGGNSGVCTHRGTFRGVHVHIWGTFRGVQCAHIERTFRGVHIGRTFRGSHLEDIQCCDHLRDIQGCAHLGDIQGCAHLGDIQGCAKLGTVIGVHIHSIWGTFRGMHNWGPIRGVHIWGHSGVCTSEDIQRLRTFEGCALLWDIQGHAHLGAIQGCAVCTSGRHSAYSESAYQDIFFLYFLAGYCALATTLLMSPICDFNLIIYTSNTIHNVHATGALFMSCRHTCIFYSEITSSSLFLSVLICLSLCR